MVKIDTFKAMVEESINLTDDKSDRYKNLFYTMRISFIVITGLVTILSGLQGVSDKTFVLNCDLVLGALVTALTSCDTLFQIETKKNVYKLMKVELKELRNELKVHAGEEKLQQMIDEVLYPKYLNIMAYSKVFIEKRETPAKTQAAGA